MALFHQVAHSANEIFVPITPQGPWVHLGGDDEVLHQMSPLMILRLALPPAYQAQAEGFGAKPKESVKACERRVMQARYFRICEERASLFANHVISMPAPNTSQAHTIVLRPAIASLTYFEQPPRSHACLCGLGADGKTRGLEVK